MVKVTEKCFYICLIIILLILAILLPVIIIQTGSRKSAPYFYLERYNESTQVEDDYTSKYFSTNELFQYLEDFARNRSLLYSTNTIGKTKPANNPIYEVVLKKKGETKSMALIVSGIQGCDWTSVTASVHIMHKFFSDVRRTTRLLKHFSFHFIPLLNPDGYNFSMSLPIHSNWEKNVEGFDADNKPKGREIMAEFDKEENIEEVIVFKEYFKKNKDKIKAVFLLITTGQFVSDSTGALCVLTQSYAGNGTRLEKILDLAMAIQEELKMPFSFDIGSAQTGMEAWIDKETKPNQILVSILAAGYLHCPLEHLRLKTKVVTSKNVKQILTKVFSFLETAAIATSLGF